ncbi:MAG: hypothetical protein GC166_12925 [Alphaproteobacteria bacterium]|nr:hypothetical protein [Alphaproteobacteria bacterium]
MNSVQDIVRKRYSLFTVAMLAAFLTGCASGPPYYGPKQHAIGYTDERLGDNRYRVTYAGGISTRRQTVEDYLLLRSAEVTLASGFSHFVFDTRDTKANTTYYSAFDGWPGWHGYGWYWHSWPFDDREEHSVTRFEAYAEIVMLTDEQAKSEPRALDAKDVVARIGPRAAPPKKPDSH